jgi:DNA-directed RNA polymerase specialized sigma24 family protein
MCVLPLRKADAVSSRQDGESPGGMKPPRPDLVGIEEALMTLNREQRLVLALSYYEKLSLKEVAEVLRVPAAQAERVHREAVDGVIRHLSQRSRRRAE